MYVCRMRSSNIQETALGYCYVGGELSDVIVISVVNCPHSSVTVDFLREKKDLNFYGGK